MVFIFSCFVGFVFDVSTFNAVLYIGIALSVIPDGLLLTWCEIGS